MAAITRRCPICKRKVIRRREIQTCGGVDCVGTWKGMTGADKEKATEIANAMDSPTVAPNPITQKELDDWMLGSKEANKIPMPPNTRIFQEGDSTIQADDANEPPSKLADILGIKPKKESEE